MKKLIVGMTGASGSIIGVRLMQVLAESEVETHLVASKWAQQTLEHETGMSLDELKDLADYFYGQGDMGATISSGSFITDGMVVAPCSMRTVSAIASGVGDHLVQRAADVILKERRRLVLIARESPLNDIHLANMLKLSRMGVTILPPMMAFYNHPETIDDMINHVVARVLDQFSIPSGIAKRWKGDMKKRTLKVRRVR